MKVALLAPGPSMSQAVADRARAECDAVVAINNCYELAPWADALAAQDRAWWGVHAKAKEFAGRKFSACRIDGVERIEAVTRESSSGVLALEVARMLGATEVHLHGFDNRGDHYFGKHPSPLNNTTPGRFLMFAKQLADTGEAMKKDGIRIINKTPGSALKCFEHG